ncbi:hypothetical protein MO973_14755 [Paenibacillus sp. TRM 82003]|nr:hypothetical protein [Paenibacillus sp. TRM 82003]
MYNQYQPSFTQQQPMVQSQYRGLQKQFQPTGYVQSFYQTQQPSGMMQTSQYHTTNYVGNRQGHDSSFREDSRSPSNGVYNYHTSNYVGNKQDHDAYLREDSMGPSTYATGRAQQINTLNGVQGTYNVNTPTSQFVGTNFQGTNSYHTANYVGNKQDHDAYLREDSLRASTYATGRTQGINSLNSNPGTYNVNVPTNQIMQGQSFGQFRNF